MEGIFGYDLASIINCSFAKLQFVLLKQEVYTIVALVYHQMSTIDNVVERIGALFVNNSRAFVAFFSFLC